MDNMLCEKDVAVIGAGPVGLFSVFSLGMAKLQSCVIDSMSEVGGQCAALYPEKPIYDIPGFPSISGEGLVENLTQQAAPFKPQYILDSRVIGMVRDGQFIIVQLNSGQQVRVRAILIAAGAGAFTPNKPNIKNLEPFDGKTVLFSVKSVDKFRDKKVVIAGGGDSALDWALLLSKVAQEVILVHRRDSFRAHESTQDQLKEAVQAGHITLKVFAQLESLGGDESAGCLTQATIRYKDDSEEQVSCDYLLPFFGIATDLGPLQTWGMDMEGRRIVADPTTCATSVGGVYAVGDVSTYPNKRKLIAVGFSETMYAAQSIYRYIHPDQVFRAGYSTNVGVPQE